MAEIQNRTNRDLATRDKSARYVYKPSSTLPDPTPEPNYTFRWIATHVLGQSDPTNVSRKLRDGYEPVKAVDHPEMMVAGNEKTGNIEIGGLMLCKIPSDRAAAMAEYYNGQAQNQMDSVDNNFMRQNDPRMPLFADRKSTVTRGGFGNGIK
jgi:hypothetical protein